MDDSTERQKETGAYRPKGVAKSRVSGDTLFSAFQMSAESYPEHLCLDSLTYREVHTLVKELGRGIVRLDLAKKMVGVLGENTPLALVADLAIMSQGLVSVILPGEQSAEERQTLWKQTSITTLFLSGKPPAFLTSQKPSSLSTIVLLSDKVSPTALSRKGYKVLGLEDVLAAGRHSSPRSLLSPSSTATVVYEDS